MAVVFLALAQWALAADLTALRVEIEAEYRVLRDAGDYDGIGRQAQSAVLAFDADPNDPEVALAAIRWIALARPFRWVLDPRLQQFATRYKPSGGPPEVPEELVELAGKPYLGDPEIQRARFILNSYSEGTDLVEPMVAAYPDDMFVLAAAVERYSRDRTPERLQRGLVWAKQLAESPELIYDHFVAMTLLSSWYSEEFQDLEVAKLGLEWIKRGISLAEEAGDSMFVQQMSRWVEAYEKQVTRLGG